MDDKFVFACSYRTIGELRNGSLHGLELLVVAPTLPYVGLQQRQEMLRLLWMGAGECRIPRLGADKVRPTEPTVHLHQAP